MSGFAWGLDQYHFKTSKSVLKPKKYQHVMIPWGFLAWRVSDVPTEKSRNPSDPKVEKEFLSIKF